MFNNTKKDGRIFISYRRSDAVGYAGRLADSLEDYFGNNRVFRDIEDIKGGAAFGEVIETNIKSADAVIVLIGPTWLSVTGEDNTPRLLATEDWVAQEIASAIELDIPLFPVLIEQTPMPRQDELPEKLHPILQYNAMTVSDRSWQSDVIRLGKILSFDIPSANERKVNFAKRVISISIFLTLGFTSCMLFYNFLDFFKQPEKYSDSFKAWKEGGTYQGELVKRIKEHQEMGIMVFKKEAENNKLNSPIGQMDNVLVAEQNDALERIGIKVLNAAEIKSHNSKGIKLRALEDVEKLENFHILEHWQTVPPYIAIGISLLLMFYVIPLIEKERQKYLFASIYWGAICTFVVLILLWPIDRYEAIWVYVGSIVTAMGMLAFMNVSGFKVK